MAYIEKRGENKYRLNVSSGFKPDGSRQFIRKTITASSRREAEKQLALFISEIEANKITPDSSMKFKDFVVLWDNNYAKTNLSQKTYYRYQEYLYANIFPALAEKRLSEIKPVDLLNLYTYLASDGVRRDGKPGGYSNKTIQHIHRLISSIYNKAIEWQVIGYNPATGVKPPKVERKEIAFYSLEDVHDLIDELEDEPMRPRTMILLALYTGMRRGEILGLTWDCIDFAGCTITINKSAVYIAGMGRIDKSPKTARSNRVISMSKNLSEIMWEYKCWQDNLKMMLGNKWQNSPFVFTNDFGCTLHPDAISTWFARFLVRKNLKHISFHGLRHTAATLMINSGVDVETISRILGHSSSNVTSQVYLHSSNAVRSDAMDKLDQILNSQE